MTLDEKQAKQLQEQKKWSEAFASLWASDSLSPQMREWAVAFQEVLNKHSKQLQLQQNMDVWRTAFQSIVESWNVNPTQALNKVISQSPILPLPAPSTVPINYIPTQHLSATNTKNDWLKIKNILETNGIKCFYHFTDRSNLPSIKDNGGLFSWFTCEKKRIKIEHPGGDPDSRIYDSRYNLQDYVRLSFCNDHPMAYRHKQAGADLVLLKIALDVAYQEATLFSDRNATATGHSIGGTEADLKKIDFCAVKKHYVSRTDPEFTPHQAECLVKTFIPLKYILNIDHPDKM